MTAGTSFSVEQGPEWLARLLYHPPEWLPGVLMLAVLLGGVCVVWLLARADVDADVVSEAATNVTVLVVTILATRGIMHAGLPYAADVVIGAAIGIAAGYGAAGPLARQLWRDRDALRQVQQGNN